MAEPSATLSDHPDDHPRDQPDDQPRDQPGVHVDHHSGETTDAVLVRRAIAGQPAAFGQLHHRYAGLVRAELRRRGVRSADVDDLAQEVFTRAWLGLHRLRDRERFGPWVRRIAQNAVIDHHRHTGCRPGLLAEAFDADRSPSGPEWCPHRSAELRAFVESVRTGMAGLASRDELVLTMAVDGRSSPDEIAAELGTTPGNARVLLHRARRRLRADLAPLLDAS